MQSKLCVDSVLLCRVTINIDVELGSKMLRFFICLNFTIYSGQIRCSFVENFNLSNYISSVCKYIRV